jgi:hypothetical protein
MCVEADYRYYLSVAAIDAPAMAVAANNSKPMTGRLGEAIGS